MALTKTNLANIVEGILPVANGGTGATTQAGAAANVLPSQASQTGKYLTTDGTNTSWGTVTSNPGTVTSITAGTGLSGGTITSSGTIAVANTAVTAGSYTNASLTVNAQGQLTAASSGTAPVTSVGAGTGISSSGGTTPTITNTGVTSVTAGTGISVSGSTGGVTITNSGVTSVNGSTGAVTVSSSAAAASSQAQNNTLYTIGTPSNTQLTGMSVTITPSSTSSKILLHFGMGYSYSGAATYVFNFARNGSSLNTMGAGSYNGLAGTIGTIGCNDMGMSYIDSPATTSAVTYTVLASGDGTLFVGRRANDTFVAVTQTLHAVEIRGT